MIEDHVNAIDDVRYVAECFGVVSDFRARSRKAQLNFSANFLLVAIIGPDSPPRTCRLSVYMSHCIVGDQVWAIVSRVDQDGSALDDLGIQSTVYVDFLGETSSLNIRRCRISTEFRSEKEQCQSPSGS